MATETRWQDLISGWCERWGVPGLAGQIRVRVSTRLRTTLGRCDPVLREIRIAAFLLEAPPGLLHEVLCHEVAHAAVFELHGRGARPHGSEWKSLMRACGFEPRVRLQASALDALPEPARRRRVVWEHRCPVCRMRRLAGRPVPQWRCAACRSLGLDGRVEIARLGPASQARL